MANDPELDKILRAAGDEGAVYIPVETVTIWQVVDARFVPDPAGIALMLSLANGRQYRVPFDWSSLQQFKRLVAHVKLPGTVGEIAKDKRRNGEPAT